jgi:hypothetical protein
LCREKQDLQRHKLPWSDEATATTSSIECLAGYLGQGCGGLPPSLQLPMEKQQKVEELVRSTVEEDY